MALPRPADLPWREEILPRAIAAAGTVVLLVVAWRLASGIVQVVRVDRGVQERMRIGFTERWNEARPGLPPPAIPPAAGPTTSVVPPPSRAAAAPLRPDPPVVVSPPGSPGLFDENGRPRLPTESSDRWLRPPAAAPGSGTAVPDDGRAMRRLTERPNPVNFRDSRFSPENLRALRNQAQSKIEEFLFGKDVQHARARPSPDIAFNPLNHARPTDLGSEATGDAYKAAPIAYQPAPGLDGEASRRIREQVAALETAYAHCDRVRLRALMQPLLLHLDELQKAEAAIARGADPVRAEHMLPNVANNAYDMARRALWYADARMAGCGG